MATPEDRLLARSVRTASGCLEWQGSRIVKGYGQFMAEGERYAHRVAWVLANGPIPKGMSVLHRCDNPPCCDPDHLFLGTIADNNADMRAKGRQARDNTHGHTTLSPSTVAYMRVLRSKKWSLAQIADEVGCRQSTVSRILNGVRRPHLMPQRTGSS